MGAMQQSMIMYKAAGGSIVLTAYNVVLYQSGGGSVTFSMNSNGSTNGDSANTKWYNPETTGVGTGKWVILTSTAGAMSVSGTIGSRVQLSTSPFWTGSYTGASVRNRTFSIEIYDASTGGNLLGSGTLYMEIDGS